MTTNGQWKSDGAVHEAFDGEANPLSSDDGNIGSEQVINGQDMALLQRPLLESPFGSDCSKGDDSVKESTDDQANKVSDNQNPNMDFKLVPGYVGENSTSARLKNEDSVALTVNTDLSGEDVEKVAHLSHDAKIGSSPILNNSLSIEVIDPRMTPGQNQTAASVVLKKRDRQKESAVSDTVELPAKKSRQDSGFGTLIDPPVDPPFGLAALRSIGAGNVPFPHQLGDGKEIKNKLLEPSTFGNLAHSTTSDRLTTSSAGIAPPKMQNISSGIFDDAEEDEMFEPKRSETSRKEGGQSVRPDLVAAILGSPTQQLHSLSPPTAPAPTIAAVPMLSTEVTDSTQKSKKVKVHRSIKKVWTAKKEEEAANTMFRGKIDLKRVLSDEHSDFLGRHCFLFTLQQLEYMLDDDEHAPEALLKGKLRQHVQGKLIEVGVLDRDPSANLYVDAMSQPDDVNDALHHFRIDADGQPKREENGPLTPSPQFLTSAHPEVPHGSSSESSASQIFLNWKSAISDWKQRTSLSRDNETEFILSGPLSQFIPAGTMQFFRSVNLNQAVELLSLKKTETGLVIDLFQAWRKKCGLKRKSPLALSKHLLGICSRIEMAVGSKAGIDANDMHWINDAMVILTGAAKDFIIDDCKICSAEQFIEMKTKFLADKLSGWRARMGFPVLKGSGKVAMISAWKSMLKDEVEVHKSDGKVVPETELRSAAETQEQVESPPKKRKNGKDEDQHKRKSPKKEIPPPRYTTAAANEALTSESFFTDIFGDDERNMTMFRLVGITTAQKLLEADKGQNSEFLKAVINMKADQSGGSVQSSSCIRLLYNWASKVKAKLDDVEQGKTVEASKSGFSDDAVDEEKNEKPRSSNRERRQQSSNPFDALSSSSKEFLATMGINNATEFLSARTTEIANAFIAWREEKKMTALKGLGAVASISGWKKLVRNKAVSVGDEDLALLNQASNSKAPCLGMNGAKPKRSEKKGFLERESANEGEKGQNKHLRGLSSLGNTVFHFETDTRRSSDGEQRQYLTYVGNNVISKASAKVVAVEAPPSVMAKVDDPLLPVNGRIPYESKKHGMLELECDDSIGEHERDEIIDVAEREEAIRKFVLSQFETSHRPEDLLSSESSHAGMKVQCLHEMSSSHLPPESNLKSTPYVNVYDALLDGKTRRFLYLSQPIEKGQSVELKSSPNQPPGSSVTSTSEARLWIERSLLGATNQTLLRLVDSLCTNLAPQFMDIGSAGVGGSNSLISIISRRRYHWVMTRIHERFNAIPSSEQNDTIAKKLVDVRDFLWSKTLVAKLENLPIWSIETLQKEIRDELIHELSRNDDMKAFLESRDSWCDVASSVFNRSLDLFSEYCAVLENLCPDGMRSKIGQIVYDAVAEIKAAAENTAGVGPDRFDRLALCFKNTTAKLRWKVLPSFGEILRQTAKEPYRDDLSLRGERPLLIEETDDLRVVALKGISGTVIWKSLSEITFERDSVDTRWYTLRQVSAIIQAVADSAFVILRRYDGEVDSLESVNHDIEQAVRNALKDSKVTLISSASDESAPRGLAVPKFISDTSRMKCDYQPNSSPFFHGFIWPVLRGEGWRLVAGNTPQDIVYCPPTYQANAYSDGRQREKVARQRAHLARESRSIGLGYLPKLTKRLFELCTRVPEDDGRAEEAQNIDISPINVSVRDVLKVFGHFLSEQVTEKGATSKVVSKVEIQRRIEVITEAMESLFDKMAAHTFSPSDSQKLDDGARWSEVLGSRHLMKILLVLPSCLRETKLPPARQSQIILFARELLDFLARNNKRFFGESIDLPREVYEDEVSVPLFLSQKLLISAGEKDDVDGFSDENHEIESLEIVQNEDRQELTDFTTIVMDQTIISYATEEDTARKNRRITVGHPCIVCRHCHGRHGEGKYFFGSMESMTTAATVIEKHLLRCPDIEQSVKDRMTKVRSKHAEQRKALPTGAQTSFFGRLFQRLQSMGPSQDGSSSFFFPMAPSMGNQNERDPALSSDDATDSGDGFKNHVEVLEFIQSSEPWKSNEVLVEAVEKYYNCLQYGGRIANTKKAPTNFSSEWLYSKIAPSN